MRIQIPDPIVQEAILEVLGGDSTLSSRLDEFALHNTDRQMLIVEATVSVSRALLLAKCVLGQDEQKLRASFQSEMAKLRPYEVLIELGLAIVRAESLTQDDVFRDKTLISDALFSDRLTAIKNCLVQ